VSGEGRRTKLLWLVLTVLWLAVAGRLAFVQIARGRHYRALARQLHWTKVALVPQRGTILDREGRPLTLNRSCCSIRILPQYARDKDTLADLLAGLGFGGRGDIMRELVADDHLFWFRRRIDYASPESLRGVLVRHQFHNCTLVDDDLRRTYPYGAMLSTLVGCVGDERGLAGIEAEYDSILRGRADSVLLQKDAIGRSYPDPSYPTRAAVPGADIRLTIDIETQEIAWSVLRSTVRDLSALRGSALVLDARTGEVLALADYPSYDPEEFSEYPDSLWKSAAVCDEIEPGSSFKLVTCAAALESPMADSIVGRSYDVSSGYCQIGQYKINDAHPNGVLDFDSVFIQSSNAACAMMSYSMDAATFYETARGLGFTMPVALGLPYEGRGVLDPPQELKGLRFANVAFGQGTTVTLVQLAAAYLCVANDGTYLRPQIVRSIRSGDRTVAEFTPARARTALRRETARRIKSILRRVVTGGTGTLANVPGLDVCGKTGTAQKVEPGGGYSDTRSRMTFVGFFPEAAPKYVVAVLVDEPKGVRFAGAACCPAFRQIAERLVARDRTGLATTAGLALPPGSPPAGAGEIALHGQ
jgi:cell division protein FtsI (penicillin-binding protein 3)